MTARLVRFIRREASRARALALPAALLAALSIFALIQLPSANTAWTQQVTLSAGVGTGSFSCTPYAVAYAGAHESGGNTTYSYTLTGGGANPITCKGIVSLALPVCFNPGLVGGGGSVVSESHPLTPTGWGYTSDDTPNPMLVKWSVTGDTIGAGPFTTANGTFTFTVAGTGIPLDGTATAKVGVLGASSAADAGTVTVPKPASCDPAAPQAALKSAAPAAASDATGVTPNADGPLTAGVVPSGVVPTDTPTPVPAADDPPPVRSGNGVGSFVPGPNATSVTPSRTKTPTPSTIGTADY